jgi:hypothetical protein
MMVPQPTARSPGTELTHRAGQLARRSVLLHQFPQLQTWWWVQNQLWQPCLFRALAAGVLVGVSVSGCPYRTRPTEEAPALMLNFTRQKAAKTMKYIAAFLLCVLGGKSPDVAALTELLGAVNIEYDSTKGSAILKATQVRPLLFLLLLSLSSLSHFLFSFLPRVLSVSFLFSDKEAPSRDSRTRTLQDKEPAAFSTRCRRQGTSGPAGCHLPPGPGGTAVAVIKRYTVIV